MAAPKDGGRAAAGAAGGRGQPKMAAEARRRPLGRNGVVSPGGGGPRRGRGGAGRGGLRPTDGLSARCLGPPPGRLPARPQGAGRQEGVGGAGGPRARSRPSFPPPPFSSRPLGGVVDPPAPPPLSPDPLLLPGGAFGRGRGRSSPLLPRTAQAGPRPRTLSPWRGGTWAARTAGVCELRVGGPVTALRAKASPALPHST